MRKLHLGAAAVAVAIANVAPANDLTLGGGAITTASITSDLFFYDPAGLITVTGVVETAGSTTACGIGLTPSDVQIGRATGYQNMNGIALSNAYLEDLDEDGVGPSGLGCFGGDGGTGVNCTGIDPVLSDAISVAELGVPGAGPGTSNAAIVEVMFTAAAATTVDISYNFMTMETPLNGSFFDTFGIIYDGVLVAGGRSNLGPPAGTDPWVLSPGTPGEFQSMGLAFWVIPAHETGIRTLTLTVTPGPHTLSFHVADGGPSIDCGLGPAPNMAACDIVPSVLIVGPHTFGGSTPGAVTSGTTISRIGHPSPTGAPFPADLQATLSGAPPGSATFLVAAAATLPPTTFPLIAPLEAYLAPVAILAGPTVDASGFAAAPSPPPTFTAGVLGTTAYVQFFGFDFGTGSFFNTKAMRIDFGP